jgi:hypothetical protein
MALGKEIIFLKNSLPSAFLPDTRQSWEICQNWLAFPALPSVFVIALGKGFLYRVLHSAK